MSVHTKVGQPWLFDDETKEMVGLKDADGNESYFFGLQGKFLTVGAKGAKFKTIQAALDYISTKPCFVARTDLGSPVATAWTQGTSAVTLSSTPPNGTYNPNTHMWFKAAGDTYYYPVESSTGFATGVGTLYSAINRIEANLVGSKAVTFYEEQNYTILVLDPWVKEVISPASLASAMSVTITSLGGSVLDFVGTSAMNAWVNGRIKFHNVALTFGAFGYTENFSTLQQEMVNCKIDTAQADMYSPAVYAGSVDMEFCRVNSHYNATRGHMLNFLTKGDQKFKNISWQVNNNAGISSVGAISNAFFIDRFYARNIFLENVRGNLLDPHSDFGYAAIVGAGSGTATGGGSAAYADYISIQDCNLVMRHAAAATMKLNILSVSDGVGINLGATTAGVSGGIIDIHNSGVIAPRGTSTRKLVEAIANPTNAITINHGVNPFAQAKDTQANITYAAIS